VVTGETLTLTVPAPLAHELGSTTEDFLADLLARRLREVKVESALDRYAHGGMSFGAAAQQAGVSQGALARCAYARGTPAPALGGAAAGAGVEPPFSEETVAEELGEAA
jgi:hypothetical protein